MSYIICHSDGSKDYYDNNGNLIGKFVKNDIWKLYFWNNQRHRLDGPAVEVVLQPNNTLLRSEWWYCGRKIDCQTQEEYEKILRWKAFW